MSTVTHRPRHHRFLVLLMFVLTGLLGAAVTPGVSLAIPGPPPRAYLPLMLRLPEDRIAFLTTRDGNMEIYVMNGDGSNQTRLTNTPSNEFAPFLASPTWSPDGEKIAFISTRDGNHEIYIMNGDGTNQVRITHTPGSEHGIAWSPDGSHLAYFLSDTSQELHITNIDGSEVISIPSNASPVSEPRWSRDGAQLAFVSSIGDKADIYTIHADGTELRRLTDTLGEHSSPAWSPTEDRIAFASFTMSGNDFIGTLSLINPNGTGKTTILTTMNSDQAQLAWSPDGTRLVFISRYTNADPEISVVNADGSGFKTLTNNTADDLYPSWSPDGTKILFHSDRDHSGIPEVYVMNADGSNQTRLTNAPTGSGYPSWRPTQ